MFWTIDSSRSTDTVQMYPWIQYKDIKIWPTPPLMRNADEHFSKIKDLESREDDVLLCTAPKSGTHWIHEIVSMLLSQTTEYNSMGNFLDMVLAFQEIETINAIKGQRLMHAHLPIRFLPKQHLEKRRKIVYLNRNPKDRHVSMYNWLKGKMGVSDSMTWSEYFDKHVITDNFLGGWFNYTKEMATAVHDKTLNIFPVLYEDLITDPKTVLIKLAEFLEVQYTDNFIEEMIEKCQFDNMKDRKIDVTATFSEDGTSNLFRKGKIGDWKNWFTVAQNEQFDEIYKREMSNADVQFIFEEADYRLAR